MFQLDLNRNIFIRDIEPRLVVLETEQNELSDAQEKQPKQPAQKRKSRTAQKSERPRNKREGINLLITPWNTPIEPLVQSDPAPSVFLLSAPLHIHTRIEGDHVEIWWSQVDSAAEYELWVCPQAFDVPEPPADCLYKGLDHAFILPTAKVSPPGFYHFQARAVDAVGRPGAWSSDHSLPFHVPILEPEVTPGLNAGELTIRWEPVESARYYEILMDQRVVYNSEEATKHLENLPLGLHDIKVRPVFAGGAVEWGSVPAVLTRLEPPLEITPDEVSILGDRKGYTLRWVCSSDSPVDSFIIVDPDHDRRVFGQVLFEACDKSWLASFYRSRKSYRWPIPPALQIEGQRFAVQAVKGKVTGPVSDIKAFPLMSKPQPVKIPINEVECSVGDLDPTLREFLRKKQVHEKLTEQKLEIYESPSHLRQYSVYHRPVLQAMNLQPRTDYRLSLTLNNGQLWQVEIIFNPKTYRYNLTFQGISGS